MKKTKLSDGTPIYCLKGAEAIVLDDHIKGYLTHGIELHDGDVVVDVGANIGVFGLRASQWFNNIEIHSFEPVPQIYEVLTQNTVLSANEGFHAYQMGLGAKEDHMTITYFPNAPALSTTSPEMWEEDPDAFKKAVKGSVRNAPDSMWYAKLVPNFMIPMIARKLMKGRQEMTCKIGTLSGMMKEQNISKINLLKLDCEGHEWEVLQGILEEDWPKIESLVMEVHDVNGRAAKTEALLREKGFNKITAEKEKALEETSLINLYALR
ncbi:MAG: FkbM family methyltransferase [Flavobacteriales bacterium]|nr:FkbM family methyltransferase [Flavobacteriales bacterium]